MIATRNSIDMYMVVLSSLSNSDKLELIARLSNSMREDADKKRMRPNLRTCFKGDWSGIDADSLRNHEYHGRTVDSWQAMKQYLLDTDVCIELIKHNERVLDKVEAVGAENCFVTDITIAELFFGAAKSGRAGHFDDVDNIIQSFDLKPLLPSLRLYGENKALLEDQGRMIGEFDLLIGSCAVYHDLTMVTSNLKHFDHIPGIELEDWAQKSKYKK